MASTTSHTIRIDNALWNSSLTKAANENTNVTAILAAALTAYTQSPTSAIIVPLVDAIPRLDNGDHLTTLLHGLNQSHADPAMWRAACGLLRITITAMTWPRSGGQWDAFRRACEELREEGDTSGILRDHYLAPEAPEDAARILAQIAAKAAARTWLHKVRAGYAAPDPIIEATAKLVAEEVGFQAAFRTAGQAAAEALSDWESELLDQPATPQRSASEWTTVLYPTAYAALDAVVITVAPDAIEASVPPVTPVRRKRIDPEHITTTYAVPADQFASDWNWADAATDAWLEAARAAGHADAEIESIEVARPSEEAAIVTVGGERYILAVRGGASDPEVYATGA